MKKLLLIVALFVAIGASASPITSTPDGKKKEKKECCASAEKKECTKTKKATVQEEGTCASKCSKAKECTAKEKAACEKKK